MYSYIHVLSWGIFLCLRALKHHVSRSTFSEILNYWRDSSDWNFNCVKVHFDTITRNYYLLMSLSPTVSSVGFVRSIYVSEILFGKSWFRGIFKSSFAWFWVGAFPLKNLTSQCISLTMFSLPLTTHPLHTGLLLIASMARHKAPCQPGF